MDATSDYFLCQHQNNPHIQPSQWRLDYGDTVDLKSLPLSGVNVSSASDTNSLLIIPLLTPSSVFVMSVGQTVQLKMIRKQRACVCVGGGRDRQRWTDNSTGFCLIPPS